MIEENKRGADEDLGRRQRENYKEDKMALLVEVKDKIRRM